MQGMIHPLYQIIYSGKTKNMFSKFGILKEILNLKIYTRFLNPKNFGNISQK